MKIAQELYEGIDVDGSGPVGLITYMRTDSLRVSDEALDGVRELIKTEYGEQYLPPSRSATPPARTAQEAHEAIRPTDLTFTPETDQGAPEPRPVPALSADLLRGSSPARWPRPSSRSPTWRSRPAPGLFKAQGKVLKFDGHRRVWPPGGKQEDELLPALTVGQALDLHDLDATQHFTQPPPRYSEATLIKALEKEASAGPAPMRRSSRRSRTAATSSRRSGGSSPPTWAWP